MPRPSLCPLTIIRATHREVVAAATAGGFDAVGLRLIAPRSGDPVHPIEGGARGIADLRQLMSGTGGGNRADQFIEHRSAFREGMS